MCRVALAAVFVVAGIAKLFDLPGSRKAVEGFGVAPGPARLIGTLLPIAEIVVAAALIPPSIAQWGALAALLLLLAFMGGIANAMRQGKAPDCNCFGQIHSAPAGRGTLARNAGLAVVAGVAFVAGPGPSIGDWVGNRTAAELVAVLSVAALVVLAVTAARIWRESRGMRSDLASMRRFVNSVPPGLWVGAMAPEIAIPGDNEGPPVTLASLRARGLPVAVVFIDPGCGPCEVLIPDVVRWQQTVSDRLTIAFVGRRIRDRYSAHLAAGGTEEDTPAELVDDIEALYDVFRAYRVTATPCAVIVTPEGTIASATVDGKLGIESLLRLTMARTSPDRDVTPPLQPAA